MKRVCVYCGASPGARPAYTDAATATGRLLAERGLGLVYGGGTVGLMGVIADAVMAAGGEAIGIIPRSLWEREIGHSGVTELQVVESMHERKQAMADASDAFIAMPGGVGTIEELVEMFTWLQLGYHGKPIGLLDVEGYWQPLVSVFDHAVGERFLTPEHRSMLLIESDPAALLDAFEAWEPPHLDKWIDRT